ncbi:hypothetical protein [Bradyrhizobium neotropicale]|uniref:hypothetical protein n=1 Tax=Bradyrhizobium neotropicale TaxID=1497615 RepID=UPI0011AB5B39|nr:hypothetical protein [Bradyrhizobium neotropicale]
MTGEENAAITSERLRITGILTSAEGRRNPDLALEMAESGLDVETAKRLLAKAPPAANPYLQAMDREGQIGLSAATVDISSDPKAARLKEIEVSIAALNAEKGWTKTARARE